MTFDKHICEDCLYFEFNVCLFHDEVVNTDDTACPCFRKIPTDPKERKEELYKLFTEIKADPEELEIVDDSEGEP